MLNEMLNFFVFISLPQALWLYHTRAEGGVGGCGATGGPLGQPAVTPAEWRHRALLEIRITVRVARHETCIAVQFVASGDSAG